MFAGCRPEVLHALWFVLIKFQGDTIIRLLKIINCLVPTQKCNDYGFASPNAFAVGHWNTTVVTGTEPLGEHGRSPGHIAKTPFRDHLFLWRCEIFPNPNY